MIFWLILCKKIFTLTSAPFFRKSLHNFRNNFASVFFGEVTTEENQRIEFGESVVIFFDFVNIEFCVFVNAFVVHSCTSFGLVVLFVSCLGHFPNHINKYRKIQGLVNGF